MHAFKRVCKWNFPYATVFINNNKHKTTTMFNLQHLGGCILCCNSNNNNKLMRTYVGIVFRFPSLWCFQRLTTTTTITQIAIKSFEEQQLKAKQHFPYKLYFLLPSFFPSKYVQSCCCCYVVIAAVTPHTKSLFTVVYNAMRLTVASHLPLPASSFTRGALTAWLLARLAGYFGLFMLCCYHLFATTLAHFIPVYLKINFLLL